MLIVKNVYGLTGAQCFKTNKTIVFSFHLFVLVNGGFILENQNVAKYLVK
jgi:hypothetical protein